MFMTLVLAASALAVASEGYLTMRGRFRRRAPWEPAVRDLIEHRDTGWIMVAKHPILISALRDATKRGRYSELDALITAFATNNGLASDEWHQWSIDWRHGCVRFGDGKKLRAGWERSPDAGWANVFFYKVPAPVVPPKPKPAPPPPMPVLWTERDELAHTLSFLANPSAFWLAMDGKVPPLRYYDDGRVAICENGAPVEPEHADLLFDDTKKRKFIVITDNAQDGWKKRTFTSLAAAEKGIADYFVKRRESLRLFRNAEDAREGIEVQWECGVKVAWPTTGATIKQVEDGLNSFASALSAPQKGYVCCLETASGPLYFTTRREAFRYLQKEGHSDAKIVDMMGYRPREVVVIEEAHFKQWEKEKHYVKHRQRERLIVKS